MKKTINKLTFRIVSIIALTIITYTSFAFANPVFFDIYAESIYDRNVSFKNINADISILSGYVEYEDSEMNTKTKNIHDLSNKVRGKNSLDDQKKLENDLFKLSEQPQSIKVDVDKYSKNGDKDALKRVASKYKIKIVRNLLKKSKVAKKSVDTYAEMLEFQNEMMDNPSEMYKISPDPKKYPNLIKFWDDSKKVSETEKDYAPKMSDSSQLINPFGYNALVGNWYSEMVSRVDCGYFGNDKPSSGKTYQVFRNIGQRGSPLIPRNIILSWGYHQTESYATNAYKYNFTRPQTYDWWNCGWNTFRDDASFDLQDKYSSTSPYMIMEQNYNGWIPRGEPNPEVFNSGPWPYPEWSAYIYAWHRNH